MCFFEDSGPAFLSLFHLCAVLRKWYANTLDSPDSAAHISNK